MEKNEESYMWVEQNGGWDLYNWIKYNVVKICKRCLRAMPFAHSQKT